MRWATIFLALGVASCGSAQRADKERIAQIETASKAGIAACDTRFPQPRRGQQAAWARCVGEAERPLIATVPVGYRDLFEVKAATRTALSAKLDRGEISPEDAQLEAARANSQLMAELEKRQLARRAVEAQEDSAAAAYRGSLGVTCTRFGNSVSCY